MDHIEHQLHANTPIVAEPLGDSIPDDHWPGILKHRADRLIAEAIEHNVVLTIDLVPRLPLTQGNYDMVASTRPLHSQPLR